MIGGAAPLESSAQAQTRDSYCTAQQQGRYCYELFDELDPWKPREVAVYAGPNLGGAATALFYARDTEERTQRFSSGVGRLTLLFRSRTDPTDEWVTWCTASALSDNYVLTAYHCAPGALPQAYYLAAGYIRMNYVREGVGEETERFPLESDVAACSFQPSHADEICPVAGNSDRRLDFSIFRVGPNTSGVRITRNFGSLLISDRTAMPRDNVIVPQHPGSHPKTVSFGVVQREDLAGPRFQHLASTYDMSSGSPVLSSTDGAFLGLHVAGGCNDFTQVTSGVVGGCRNTAVSAASILAASSILREMVVRRSGSENTTHTATGEFRQLLRRAEDGDAESQWRVGILYEYANAPFDRLARGVEAYSGQPGEQDYAQAAHWYEAAAGQGYVPAQTDLASLFMFGQGVERDTALALQMFTAAYEAGDLAAGSWLGTLYLNGEIVARDEARGVRLLREAAIGDIVYAQHTLGHWLLYGRSGQGSDPHEGAQWIRRAANKNYARAQFALAELYRSGYGVARSVEDARRMYRLAADGGFEAARERLVQLGE